MINVAVVGTGTMGREHLKAWSAVSDAKIAGVIGRDNTRLGEISETFRTSSASGLSDLFDKTEVDVVDVCLPTHLHLDYIRQAARAKKHVICEKPLGLSVEECETAINICRENGVQLHVGHVLRFSPEYVSAHDHVENGSIGNPGVIRLRRASKYPFGRKDWYADEEKSGGIFFDLGIHDFDWLRWTFGEVERVMAKRVTAHRTSGEPLEYALVTLKMEGGAIAHVELSWAETAFEDFFELAGDKGMMTHNSSESSPVHLQLAEVSDDDTAGVAVPESILGKNPYQLELEHFANCISGSDSPIMSANDAPKAVEIAQAAIESAKTGEPVQLLQREELL